MSPPVVDEKPMPGQQPGRDSASSFGAELKNAHDDLEAGDRKADSASQTSDGSASRRSIHGIRWALVCVSIWIAAFTYGLDTTIAADVQGAVVESFGEVQQLSWLGAGFMLGSVATILPIGHLFERFNLKWCFVAGLVLFEVGSVVCGASPNIDALIVGRVIAGIGGSGVYIGALEFFSTLTTEAERGGYISSLGIFWGLGAVIGPVIGGAFSDSAATWRWGFYINLVIAAVCAPVYLIYLPDVQPLSGIAVSSKMASIDWLGAILYAALWVLFTLVFTFGGNTWNWDDGRTIAVFVVFGVLLICFVLQQRFAFLTTKNNRIFPAHLITSRTQLLLYFTMASAATSLFTPIYYIPVYFQFVHGDSAINAAVRLLPFLVISMTVNFAVGYFLPKIPYYAALYLISGVFIVSGAAPLYTINPDTPIANVYGYSILVAIGAGAILQQGYTLASVKVVKQSRPEDVSHAIALQNVAQIGSGAIALIISGQVFQTFAFRNLQAVLDGKGFTTEQIRAAVAGAQSTIFKEIDPELAADAIAAITSAMSNVYILVITAGTLTVVSSLAMRWERLF